MHKGHKVGNAGIFSAVRHEGSAPIVVISEFGSFFSLLRLSNDDDILCGVAGQLVFIRMVETVNTGLGIAAHISERSGGQTERECKQHEKYRQSLYADFNSRNDTISHDPYNQYAQDYNQALDGFPASLLAAITPVPSQAVIFY